MSAARMPVRILLVEDNRMDVELVLESFREIGLADHVHVASDGQEALDYLLGHGEYADRGVYPLPGLVLLDLRLPGVDGFEVLHRLKSTPILKRLPVVILTSSGEERDRSRSYDTGANSYLVKPTSFGGFRGIVREIAAYWLSLNVAPPFEVP
jgi:CheY-like chemotaxis protein